MTKIYLIRHAEAEGNIYRRAHGHYNGLVTDRGYRQIERLKKRFENVNINAIYSSDLTRACETATALSQPRGLPINKNVMLREVCMGEWEDSSWGDIEYWHKDMNGNFEKDPERWSVNGSEPYKDVKARMISFITETAEHHHGETIAFFSHGFAIRSLMCLLEGFSSNETSKIPYFDNTAVTILTYENNKLKVEEKGCTSHLKKEHSTLEKQTWWREEHRRISENLRFMQLNEVCSEDLLRIFKAKAGERANVDIQYVGILDDEPVGIVGIDTKKDYGMNIGWISYIHVIPKHRNKSFATQLLGLAVSDFRKLKSDRLRIELPSGNLAINFMNKYGFDAIDVTDQFFVMEKNIRNW